MISTLKEKIERYVLLPLTRIFVIILVIGLFYLMIYILQSKQ